MEVDKAQRRRTARRASRAKQRLTTRVLREIKRCARGLDRWRSTRRINGPFSAHAEAGMSCVGRSSDFRVRSSRPSRRYSGGYTGIIRATMARRMEDRLLHSIKHSVTAAGAVPESHRVPCTSALPQERPTTNAQFKQPHILSQAVRTVKRSQEKKGRRPDCDRHTQPSPGSAIGLTFLDHYSSTHGSAVQVGSSLALTLNGSGYW